MRQQRHFGVLLALVFFPQLLAAGEPKAKDIEFFESKIRPILSKHCYECHSAQAKKLKADLLLDSKAGMLKGGDSGPVLVAGKAKESLLIKVLEHDGPTKMPSQSVKLPREIIADFVKWIDMGAPDPRTGQVVSKKKVHDIDKARAYWAFRPMPSIAPPAVKNAAWPRTPIDRFILAKLEEKGLTPNGPIGRERLIRRAYFDLTGLPPTPEEAESAKPQAIYEAMIDRLLDSPRFGETWARHWLDVVRFAESGGYEFDGARPNAYHYRDFVIKAMNQDMPFDQFVRWQLAGDHLVPGDLQAIAATGFLVAGSYPGQTTSKTLALIRYDHLDDMVSTIGTSMLGLSLGCARCHEHKYDPIPQEDYYRLVAALGRTDSANVKVNTDPAGYKKAKDTFDAAHAPFIKTRDQFENGELPKFLQAFWTANKDKPMPTWLTLVPAAVSAAGKDPKNASHTIVAHTMQKKIKGARASRQELAELRPKQLVGGDIRVNAAPLSPALKAKIKPINVKLKADWTARGNAGKDHAATFTFDGDIGFDGGTILTVTVKSANTRFAITTSTGAALTGAAEPQAATELLTVLRPLKGEWKADQRDAIARWVRKLNPAAEKIYDAADQHAKSEPKPNLIDVFAAQSGRGGPVNFLIRGEPEKKREVVNPGFVNVLMDASSKDQRWYASSLSLSKGSK